jgi:hypothetical protein
VFDVSHPSVGVFGVHLTLAVAAVVARVEAVHDGDVT